MLKHQYFGHKMRTANSLNKTLMLGKIEGNRRRGLYRMRWLGGVTDWMDMNLSKLRETVEDRRAWHSTIHGFAKSWTWLSDWTTTKYLLQKQGRHTIFIYRKNQGWIIQKQSKIRALIKHLLDKVLGPSYSNVVYKSTVYVSPGSLLKFWTLDLLNQNMHFNKIPKVEKYWFKIGKYLSKCVFWLFWSD